ncbi:DUF724 domain-containing protein 2-like isoform X5 [Durio zibethinus]|uniref:DUF724 domain-containing protein 2-like isoform X5 n=1 Tax=Durio zibethinus TaxID=66656 RepID=A0A6P5ZZA5_DURZI|nr:DUF724 domain-containing protein 2-like isoform X5 [Durio zibethinus]
MVNPPPETDPSQQPPFLKGTPVEVSSDEEGFRGAWYLATILEYPPKSTSKKRKKALVQYRTLLTEDGSSPLTEYVDPAFIRPFPPKEKEDVKPGFEVNDVVDARYRDGWWTGVVRKVLEMSKYRVYFDNPPDVIEFDRKDLRVHWDWIDGKWVRPEKQQSTGSIFSSGTAVEVHIDKENLRDVWFPAIVIKENEDNTFLVKYQTSRNDDESGTGKVVVDSLLIRPTPPRYADRNYELLERVDTTYKFGWRSGVITKVLTGRRYNVFFKHGNEDKELNHSDMRPHVEWVDGKWVSKSKGVLIAFDEQEQIGNALPGTHNAEVVGELESLFSSKDNSEDKTPLTNLCKNLMEQPTPTDEKNALLSSKKKVKLETSNGNTSRSRPLKKLTDGNTVGTPLSVTGDRLKDMPNDTSCKEGTSRTGGTGTRFTKKTMIGDQSCANTESSLTGATTEIKEHEVGVNDLKRKRGRPRKSVVTSPKAYDAGKEQNGAGGLADEKAVKDCMTDDADLSKHKGVELAASQDAFRGRKNDDYKTKEVHLAIVGISNTADEDQPLSTWIGGIHSSGDEESRLSSDKHVNGWNDEREGLVEVPVESLAIDARGRRPLDDDRSLPFVKKSPVWRTIESMDVFQIVPQKPHFQPLNENREEFREGSAIGIMVTFAGLFEKISMLHFDDPRYTFDSILESLNDLEKHGFDVTLLRCRVNELLSIKEAQGQHQEKRKNAEREMIENTKEITKLDEEMEEIEKKITHLQERHTSIKLEKEIKNVKVGNLKSDVEVLNELIQKSSRDFKKIATAPWRFP